MKQAADLFLASNRWEQNDINQFLRNWKTLTAPEKNAARAEPSMRALRYELEQNLRLAAENSDTEAASRLRVFATQLDSAASP